MRRRVGQLTSARRVDEARKFLRVGSGEIILEMDLSIEASSRTLVTREPMRSFVAERFVSRAVVDQAEGASGVVSSTRARAWLSAVRGRRGGKATGGEEGEGEEDGGKDGLHLDCGRC